MTAALHSDTLRIVPRRGGANWQVMDGDQPVSIIYEKLESAMASLERLQRKARIKRRRSAHGKMMWRLRGG